MNNNKGTGDRTVHVQCMFSFLHATHGLKNHLTTTNYDMIVRSACDFTAGQLRLCTLCRVP